MLELRPGARWSGDDFPPVLANTAPWGFCAPQSVSEDVSHDVAACEIALVSLFRTAIIAYF